LEIDDTENIHLIKSLYVRRVCDEQWKALGVGDDVAPGRPRDTWKEAQPRVGGLLLWI
jgi:hypothetical protein